MKTVGFIGIYLIKIYEDIFSRRSGRSGVISLLTFYFILATQLYLSHPRRQCWVCRYLTDDNRNMISRILEVLEDRYQGI